MKLAAALAQRSDMDHRIAQLKERIKASARYTEGEEPLESAIEMLAEARDLLKGRETLVARINQTNSKTWIEISEVPARMTLTEAIAWRDRLQQESKLLGEMADAASGHGDHYYGMGRRRSELPMKTELPVKEMRADADKLARRHREVDQVIQAMNWEADLL